MRFERHTSSCSGALRAVQAADKMLEEVVIRATQKAKRQLALSRSKVPVPADGLDEIETIATAKTLDELRWAQTHTAKKSLDKALERLTNGIDGVVTSLTGERMSCDE